MKTKNKFLIYWLLSLAGVLAASFYPLWMGARVIGEMVRNGAVPIESYPKYVIPYTPISFAVILGAVLMLPAIKWAGKWAMPATSLLSVIAFFVSERLMETKILVQTVERVPLEGWQMSLCYVPPERYETRTWEAVDVLLGGYSPAFKIHFYMISLVLILSLLNVFLGFGSMIKSGDRTRKKALVMQACAAGTFLGMCIWACFTSFYRTGELSVSALSAALMIVFFLLLGITVGIFVGSFLLGRRAVISSAIPSAVASITTLAMYIGEMILLNGNLYRFGEGFIFRGIPGIVLAPIDILVVLGAGGMTCLLLKAVSPGKPKITKIDGQNSPTDE